MTLLRTALLLLSATTPLAAQDAVPDGGRIVGGTPARAGEFPYQAEIVWKPDPGQGPLAGVKAHKCGGALVAASPDAVETVWVVTAAHCAYSTSFRPATIAGRIAVRVGLVRLDDPAAPPPIDIAPDGLILHPGFVVPEAWRGGARAGRLDGKPTQPPFLTDFTHDLMLVKLARPVRFGATVRPIALPDEPVETGQRVFVSGWGVAERPALGQSALAGVVAVRGAMETVLQYVAIPVIVCKPDGDLVPPTHFCAGEPGKDSCMGDSGGPAAIGGAEPILAGIVSRRPFGVATCGGRDVQTRYSRIGSEEAAWIRATMKARS